MHMRLEITYEPTNWYRFIKYETLLGSFFYLKIEMRKISVYWHTGKSLYIITVQGDEAGYYRVDTEHLCISVAKSWRYFL
jgi:hypothetical protein